MIRGSGMRRLQGLLKPVVIFLYLAAHSAIGAIAENMPPALTVTTSLEQILSRMDATNRHRESALISYTAMRTYEAANGDGDHRAKMQVKVVFNSPRTKDFTIVSEQGSSFIRNMVFVRALDTEKETQASASKQRSAVNADNYSLTLIGQENVQGRHCYVLDARPKRKDKFLIRGRVWIDAVDYAVVRVQGELAKSPSFFVRKVQLIRDYAKIGDFWLPQQDQSISQLLVFGKSTMTVSYYDYEIQTRGPVIALNSSTSELAK